MSGGGGGRDMDEEPQYVTVEFTANAGVARDPSSVSETVYDQLKFGPATEPAEVTSGRKAEAPPCPCSTVVRTCLCVTVVLAVSSLVAHVVYLSRETGELRRQNEQRRAETASLQRRTEELSAQRDRLNRTVQVILSYPVFPVDTRCPHKVCQPCEDDWLLFQSRCYWFSRQRYWSSWQTWSGGQDSCRKKGAELLVIDSREEQAFVNRHTDDYNGARHGYWMGLSRTGDAWTWAGGRSPAETFWDPEQTESGGACGLTAARLHSQNTWLKSSCDMKNRWICEAAALPGHL